MDYLRLLILFEKYLSKLIGLSSPLNTEVKSFIPRKIQCIIIYTTLYLVVFVREPEFYTLPTITSANALFGFLVIARLISLCMYIVEYTLRSGNLVRFVEQLHTRNEHFKAFQDVHVNYSKQCCKYYLINILNLVKLLESVIIISYKFNVIKFTALCNRMFELCLTMQWSLYMCHIDLQISKVKKVMKTGLQLMVLENQRALNISCVLMNPNPNETFDKAIEAYRILSSKHKKISDYYGVFFFMQFFFMLIQLTSPAYFVWYTCVSGRPTMTHYLVAINILIDVISMAVIGAVCETADIKVR